MLYYGEMTAQNMPINCILRAPSSRLTASKYIKFCQPNSSISLGNL